MEILQINYHINMKDIKDIITESTSTASVNVKLTYDQIAKILCVLGLYCEEYLPNYEGEGTPVITKSEAIKIFNSLYTTIQVRSPKLIDDYGIEKIRK